MLVNSVPTRRLVPLAATFAAVYAMLRLIPFSLWIGASGRAFTVTEFVAPLFGIMLGPYVGSAAAVVGTFLAIILTGHMNFFGLDFLPVLLNALVLGFLIRRRWAVSLLLYSVLLVLFFVNPMTLHFVSVPLWNWVLEVPFVWLHVVAWILLASPLGRRSVDWVTERTAWKATCAAFILVLVGTTAQHLTGTILFATLAVPVMGITPKVLDLTWNAVFYIYPVERFIVILAGTIVTTGVVRALMAAGLLRPQARSLSSINTSGQTAS